jgi:hypothetical protein
VVEVKKRQTTIFGCVVLPGENFRDVMREGIKLGEVMHVKGRATCVKGKDEPSTHWSAKPEGPGWNADCRSLRDAVGHLLGCAGFEDPTA